MISLLYMSVFGESSFPASGLRNCVPTSSPEVAQKDTTGHMVEDEGLIHRRKRGMGLSREYIEWVMVSEV